MESVISKKPCEGINGALYVVRGTDVNTVDKVSKLVESGVIYSLNI